jgi:1,4-dihydroxy-6-naphthoate synthase
MIVAMRIRLGHSPDADDAFMFYGLSSGQVDSGPFRIEHELVDIQTLNDRAASGELEVTAISAHAYPYVRDKYRLTRCGGSFGDGYGPRIVAAEPFAESDLAGRTVAVPGTTTSAFLALQLYRPGLKTRVLPFDKIVAAVQAGVVDCGLIIHEAQLTFARSGLHCVADLGAWWQAKTHLPLPLGCNAIRKDIPPAAATALEAVIRRSIEFGLAHRAEAVKHALQFAREMQEAALTDEFVGMYVNAMTLDMGDRGRAAMEEFLRRGAAAGLIPDALPLEFV